MAQVHARHEVRRKSRFFPVSSLLISEIGGFWAGFDDFLSVFENSPVFSPVLPESALQNAFQTQHGSEACGERQLEAAVTAVRLKRRQASSRSTSVLAKQNRNRFRPPSLKNASPGTLATPACDSKCIAFSLLSVPGNDEASART